MPKRGPSGRQPSHGVVGPSFCACAEFSAPKKTMAVSRIVARILLIIVTSLRMNAIGIGPYSMRRVDVRSMRTCQNKQGVKILANLDAPFLSGFFLADFSASQTTPRLVEVTDES